MRGAHARVLDAKSVPPRARARACTGRETAHGYTCRSRTPRGPCARRRKCLRQVPESASGAKTDKLADARRILEVVQEMIEQNAAKAKGKGREALSRCASRLDLAIAGLPRR
jgi:hypothetical protein